MLEVKNLYKSYRGIPAVEDVSFRLAAGEIVGFLGPNGAGKSTTVKMITGMLRPNEGHVLFERRDIRGTWWGFVLSSVTCQRKRIFTLTSRASSTCNWWAGCAAWASGRSKPRRRPSGIAASRILAALAHLVLLEGHAPARADCRGAAA